MTPIQANQNVTDYLNSDYQMTFTPTGGNGTTTPVKGQDFGAIENIQLVDDDLVVQTDKGVLTIHDVPQLVSPKVDHRSGEELDRVVGKDFMADFNEIMKLFLETVREQRDVNREMRNGDRQLMVSKSEEAITAMRDEAAKAFMVGMITNAVTIVSGALSMTGGIKTMKGLSAAKAAPVAAPTAPTNTGSVKTTNGLAEGVSDSSTMATNASKSTSTVSKSGGMSEAQAQATTAKYTAAGKILEGSAGATGAGITFWSTEDKEKQKRAETESGLHSSKAEDQNQYFRDSKQIVNDAMNMLKAINDARHQTNSEIVSSHV